MIFLYIDTLILNIENRTYKPTFMSIPIVVSRMEGKP